MESEFAKMVPYFAVSGLSEQRWTNTDEFDRIKRQSTTGRSGRNRSSGYEACFEVRRISNIPRLSRRVLKRESWMESPKP